MCADARHPGRLPHPWNGYCGISDTTLPTDGTRAAAEKGISVRPVGQLTVRLYQTHDWRKTLYRLLIPRHYGRQEEEVSSAFGGGLDVRR
jgi:hypothetical protein